MRTEKLKIPNRRGIELNARLELPANQKPNAFAIFAHCFTCDIRLSAVRKISRKLTSHGFGVLRFDFTGLGNSQGDFVDSHFSSNVIDLMDVHAYMSEHYRAPSLLVGHSLGGAAVIVAASQLEDVKAVATIGAPSSVNHVTHLFEDQVKELQWGDKSKITVGGRKFEIDKKFIEDFYKFDLLDILKNMRKAIMVMHSPFDKTVGIENAQELYLTAHHPKSFVSLDKADHLLTDNRDSEYVGDVIGCWVKRFFPKEENEMPPLDGEQLVAHLDIKEDNFTTSIQTKKHDFLADEPSKLGGSDFGPSPYDLLNASLASCTAMTIRMYAERKGWDVDDVLVYISHYKKKIIPEGHTEERLVDVFEKRLKFEGDLSPEQKARLIKIGGKCPIHKTLISDNIIESYEIE